MCPVTAVSSCSCLCLCSTRMACTAAILTSWDLSMVSSRAWEAQQADMHCGWNRQKTGCIEPSRPASVSGGTWRHTTVAHCFLCLLPSSGCPHTRGGGGGQLPTRRTKRWLLAIIQENGAEGKEARDPQATGGVPGGAEGPIWRWPAPCVWQPPGPCRGGGWGAEGGSRFAGWVVVG